MLGKTTSTITVRDIPPELTKKINEYVLYNCDGFYGNKNRTYIKMLEDFFNDEKASIQQASYVNEKGVSAEIAEQKYLARKLSFARAFFAITAFLSIVAI